MVSRKWIDIELSLALLGDQAEKILLKVRGGRKILAKKFRVEKGVCAGRIFREGILGVALGVEEVIPELIGLELRLIGILRGVLLKGKN